MKKSIEMNENKILVIRNEVFDFLKGKGVTLEDAGVILINAFALFMSTNEPQYMAYVEALADAANLTTSKIHNEESEG